MDDDFFLSVLRLMADPVILMIFMSAGFKFQPSPERLLTTYLEPITRGDDVAGVPMAEVNLCDHEPWDLPDKSSLKLGDREWYFICRRDLKYDNSNQLANRKTKAGYWKSTCKIKPIVSEHTKMQIGIMRTLTFYRTDDGPKAVRTGWMVYEFDIITDSRLYENGQYVLCRLENKSKDEMTDKGEQNHHMGSVSGSEAEPSQSMDSNSNPAEMAVNSACHESNLSHHVASDFFYFENQNLEELVTNPARQVSELNHCDMVSDYGNQNSDKLMANSAYDGSGSPAHPMPLNYSETQYSNQLAVDSVYHGSKSQYKAFDSETHMPVDEDRLLAYEKWLMTPGSKDQELPFQHGGERGSLLPMPSKFIKNSTSDSESTSEMDIDISDFDESDWSDNLTATTSDFDFQNPCKKTDISTNLEELYSSTYLKDPVSDNDLPDVAFPEVSSECVQVNIPNAALYQLPVCWRKATPPWNFDTSTFT